MIDCYKHGPRQESRIINIRGGTAACVKCLEEYAVRTKKLREARAGEDDEVPDVQHRK
jgi:hypothetical protein